MFPSIPCENSPIWVCRMMDMIFPFLFGWGHLWLMVIDDGAIVVLAIWATWTVLSGVISFIRSGVDHAK